MARRAARYAISMVDEIAASLRQLPPVQPETITRKEAVERMKATIMDMRSKGYSLEQVAALMRERGFAATPSTLKSDLRATRSRKRELGKRLRSNASPSP